ncbi:hypothetical protein L1887_43557 [Cichorium endivia]|nr:hypothetical protein L1887_43557 [Cichorium endivia]
MHSSINPLQPCTAIWKSTNRPHIVSDGNQFDIEGYRRDLIRKTAGSREGTVLIATLIAEMYLKMTGKDDEGSLEDTLDMIISGINTAENEAEARHFINEKE